MYVCIFLYGDHMVSCRQMDIESIWEAISEGIDPCVILLYWRLHVSALVFSIGELLIHICISHISRKLHSFSFHPLWFFIYSLAVFHIWSESESEIQRFYLGNNFRIIMYSVQNTYYIYISLVHRKVEIPFGNRPLHTMQNENENKNKNKNNAFNWMMIWK